MTQRTVTLIIPDGYATGEEFAKDCGFEIAKPDSIYPAVEDAMPRATTAVWAAMQGVCTNDVACKSEPCTCAAIFARAALTP